MKIAVAGKGGVGKTTVAGTLCRLLARDGYRVVAIDADPAMNLAYALGIPPETASKIIPLAENEILIKERTMVSPDTSVFKLYPKVSDLAEKYGILGPDGVLLMVMGTVKSGGSGCMCPANALIRALMRNLLVEREDVVIMDMEAGLEHLGRATVKGMDAILCIVEPGSQSVETTKRIKQLASDLQIPGIFAVGNKVKSQEEAELLSGMLRKMDVPMPVFLPYDPKVTQADMAGVAPIDYAAESSIIKAVETLKDKLKERYQKQ